MTSDKEKFKIGKSFQKVRRDFLWKRLIALVVIWRLLLFGLQYFTFRVWGYSSSIYYTGFETLGLWDGYWHTQIARYGYYASGLTLRFPLYPLLIRFFSPLFFGDGLIAGSVISFLAFLGAVVVLYRLATEELRNDELAMRSVILLLVFPTAFFLVAVYGESLFLLLTLMSFFFFRKERLWVAGILGGLATLVRLQGILLFPSFLIERWVRKKRWESKNLFFFIIPLALLPRVTSV